MPDLVHDLGFGIGGGREGRRGVHGKCETFRTWVDPSAKELFSNCGDGRRGKLRWKAEVFVGVDDLQRTDLPRQKKLHGDEETSCITHPSFKAFQKGHTASPLFLELPIGGLEFQLDHPLF